MKACRINGIYTNWLMLFPAFYESGRSYPMVDSASLYLAEIAIPLFRFIVL